MADNRYVSTEKSEEIRELASNLVQEAGGNYEELLKLAKQYDYQSYDAGITPQKYPLLENDISNNYGLNESLIRLGVDKNAVKVISDIFSFLNPVKENSINEESSNAENFNSRGYLDKNTNLDDTFARNNPDLFSNYVEKVIVDKLENDEVDNVRKDIETDMSKKSGWKELSDYEQNNLVTTAMEIKYPEYPKEFLNLYSEYLSQMNEVNVYEEEKYYTPIAIEQLSYTLDELEEAKRNAPVNFNWNEIPGILVDVAKVSPEIAAILANPYYAFDSLAMSEDLVSLGIGADNFYDDSAKEIFNEPIQNYSNLINTLEYRTNGIDRQLQASKEELNSIIKEINKNYPGMLEEYLKYLAENQNSYIVPSSADYGLEVDISSKILVNNPFGTNFAGEPIGVPDNLSDYFISNTQTQQLDINNTQQSYLDGLPPEIAPIATTQPYMPSQQNISSSLGGNSWNVTSDAANEIAKQFSLQAAEQNAVQDAINNIQNYSQMDNPYTLNQQNISSNMGGNGGMLDSTTANAIANAIAKQSEKKKAIDNILNYTQTDNPYTLNQQNISSNMGGNGGMLDSTAANAIANAIAAQSGSTLTPNDTPDSKGDKASFSQRPENEQAGTTAKERDDTEDRAIKYKKARQQKGISGQDMIYIVKSLGSQTAAVNAVIDKSKSSLQVIIRDGRRKTDKENEMSKIINNRTPMHKRM